MFYANPKSKVVHYQQCYHARQLKDNKEVFYSYSEAAAAGYRLCYCCSPLGAKAHLNTREMKEYCKDNQIAYRLEGDRLQIRSMCSRWYIDIDDRNKLVLHHHNTQGDPRLFHVQNVSAKSVPAYLHYIVRHDQFRSKNRLPGQKTVHRPEAPQKGSRKARADKKKYKAQRRKYEIRRVLDLIDELSWA